MKKDNKKALFEMMHKVAGMPLREGISDIEIPDVPENVSKNNTDLAMFEGVIAVELKRKINISDNEIMSYLDSYDNFILDSYHNYNDALTTTREIIEMLKQKGHVSKDINYDSEDNSELPWDSFD